MSKQKYGILYCPEEGCNHVLAIGGPLVEGMGLAHSFKKNGKTVVHEGHKKVVLEVVRTQEDENDWHTFIQSKVDEIEAKK